MTSSNGENNSRDDLDGFDALSDGDALKQSLQTLERSMLDIAAGRTRPAKDAIRQIAERLNLKIDR